MKKLLILTLTAFGVSAATEALASDAQTPAFNQPAQPESQDHNWTGFYAGVDGGYGTSGTLQPTQPGTIGSDPNGTDQPTR